MKIGILVTGMPNEYLRTKYGCYDALFEQLLDGFGFDFASFNVVVDHLLPDVDDDCDGYLITGSGHNVDDDLPWITPLTNWVQQVYGTKPIVGICFGHQIIAHALGGKVIKPNTGWRVGVQQYDRTHQEGGSYTAASWHRYQVTELPNEQITVTATGQDCPYAGLAYERGVISYQCHPEFSDVYMSELFENHNHLLPVSVRHEYQTEIDNLSVGHSASNEIADFFLSHKSITNVK